LTNEELVANLNVFIMAGHDTTANTLTYAMYYLAKYQDVQEKLRNEIYATLEVAPNNFDLAIPTAEHLKSMKYLSCFIKEVMRITPAVLQIDRQLSSDYTIPGENVVLPKGTHLNLSVYSIQKDPRIYPNPDEFNPERFLNSKYDTDVYMPFGGGTRMCVGMNFSLMEQKVFLIMLLQKFHLNIDKNNPDFK
ncbi:cytochrome P450 25A, partial [Conidiobolus coronatus NRRL 28638]